MIFNRNIYVKFHSGTEFELQNTVGINLYFYERWNENVKEREGLGDSP